MLLEVGVVDEAVPAVELEALLLDRRPEERRTASAVVWDVAG